MDRVKEIETAICNLAPEEFRRLSDWIQTLDEERWDAQMDADAESGRLDFILKEAAEERAQGLLREWPPVE